MAKINNTIKSSQFQAIDNLVLVKTTETMKDDKVTDSGIVLEVASKKSIVNDRPTQGIIISKGENVKFLDIGMLVYYPPHSGIECEYIRDNDDPSVFEMFTVLDEKTILGYKK